MKNIIDVRDQDNEMLFKVMTSHREQQKSSTIDILI